MHRHAVVVARARYPVQAKAASDGETGLARKVGYSGLRVIQSRADAPSASLMKQLAGAPIVQELARCGIA